MIRKISVLTILAASVLAPACPAIADVGARMREVSAAYFDLFAQYPQAYTCELRSPELVASLDAKARQSWGSGHILLTKDRQGLRLAAQDLANPQAAPWFNLALGLWQLKLGTELQVLQARLPSFFVGAVVGALAGYQGFEEPDGQWLRFGLRARRQNQQIRSLSLVTDTSHAIRELRVENRDGSSLSAKIDNVRSPVGGGWLVSNIEATITKSTGETEIWSAGLGFQQVGDAVLFQRIDLRVTDGRGHVLKRNPKDVNPISYRFSNCRIP